MIKLFDNKDECCGCTACYATCPKNAIEMCADDKGFQYPIIDHDLCIECGKCLKVCPFKNQPNTNSLEKPTTYAVKHLSDSTRMNSSSGGMFTLIAEYAYNLNPNTITYGAQYEKDLNVIHGKACTLNEIDKFRGSKYVQSDLNTVFREINEYLMNGESILFTGTPCQCAGLYNFLGKDYPNLIVVDLICHGIPSPLIFKEHRLWLEKSLKGKLKDIKFRYKANGWHDFNFYVVSDRGSKISYEDSYFKLFSVNLTLRNSCFECPFANLKRKSDLTIGDFWRIEDHYPQFSDEKGVSLLIVNSEKGEEISSDVLKNSSYIQTAIENSMQTNLQKPSTKPNNFDDFWRDYLSHGYDYVIRRYAEYNSPKQLTKKLLKRLGLFKPLINLKHKIAGH